MSGLKTGSRRFPWPPVVYLAAIVLALSLDVVYPLPWLPSPLADILFAAGGLLALAAILMDIGAIRAFRRNRTTMSPGGEADHLVTDGPFSFTRNPLYLANSLIMIGAGLLSGIAWLLILALAAGFFTQKIAIEPEEKQLEARFGKKYREYARRVRRWI